uniref:Uncharacterized protein n=1 Tax=Rhizophora mucronata TaxID=61149 RepID=A0A2P2P5H8_RHIMU
MVLFYIFGMFLSFISCLILAMSMSKLHNFQAILVSVTSLILINVIAIWLISPNFFS